MSEPTATRALYVALKKRTAVRDRRVYRLLGKMRALCPWLSDSDGPACRAWAEMEIIATVAYGRLRDEGLTTPAGVPRSAAMTMSGHLTESVYRRYAIVDQAMLREAAAKIEAHHARESRVHPITLGEIERLAEGVKAFNPSLAPVLVSASK